MGGVPDRVDVSEGDAKGTAGRTASTVDFLGVDSLSTFFLNLLLKPPLGFSVAFWTSALESWESGEGRIGGS